MWKANLSDKQALSKDSNKRLLGRSRLRKIKATSMPELLVTMIIAGILYIFIFDGMDMLHRLANKAQADFICKTTLMINHGIIEMMFEKADSITEKDGVFLFHTEGCLYRTLERKGDKLLIGTTISDFSPDTLFKNVSDLTSQRNENQYRIDSLSLVIVSGNDTLLLKYGLTKQ